MNMRMMTIVAGLGALLLIPQGADAQGVARGAQDGAATGNRAAGPVGGVVGGAVGGVVGGVAGGVKGILGVPQDSRVRRRAYRSNDGRRRYERRRYNR